MKKISFLTIICLIMINLCACSTNTISKIDSSSKLMKVRTKDNEFNKEVATSINELGETLIKSCSDGEKNSITSPLSLAVALSVLTNGAQENTKQELMDIINKSHLDEKTLNEQYCLLLNLLNETGYEEGGKKTTLVQSANSIWVDERFKLRDEFVKIAQEYYDSGVYSVDFNDSDSKDAMNKWISDKTNGMIKDYIEELDVLDRLFIFNTVYFNGKWVDQFNKRNTEKEKFHLKDGSEIDVDMMNAQRQMSCYEDEEIIYGSLSYYGCSMNIVIPKGNIDDYIKKFSYQELNDKLKNKEYIKCNIKLPKFKYEAEYSLNATLRQLGVEDIFIPYRANLKGILKENPEPLWVGKIKQKCVISVDEEGTEAAALTSVGLCGSAPPPEKIINLYANRPFLYFIKHDRTNTILFIGVVYKP